MANAWINQIFAAGQVNKGNMVRRSKATVLENASMAALIAEVKARGFHMIEIGEQVVIVCNAGHFKVVC